MKYFAALCVAAVLAGCASHIASPIPSRGASNSRIHGAGLNSGAHFVAEFPISSPTFSLTRGADGNVWFAEPFADSIGRITPNGTVTEFAIPGNGTPRDVAVGPDGNMWFTLANTPRGGYLGEIASSGEITLHAVPTRSPHFVVTGPDGNLWYTDDTNVIVKYRLGGTASQYAIPTPDSAPRGITAGPGGKLWFDEFAGSKVASIATDGAIDEYVAPTNPFGTPVVIDGHLWYLAQNEFVRVAPGGHVDTVALPDLPGGIVSAEKGRIWVAFQDLNEIASMNYDGSQMQTYSIPTAGANPVGMAYGSDGNIWFSEPLAPTPQIGVFHP